MGIGDWCFYAFVLCNVLLIENLAALQLLNRRDGGVIIESKWFFVFRHRVIIGSLFTVYLLGYLNHA